MGNSKQIVWKDQVLNIKEICNLEGKVYGTVVGRMNQGWSIEDAICKPNLINFESHGDNKRGSIAPEYRAWIGMKRRCYNKSYDHYQAYGGRGITVCDKWKNSYVAFLNDVGRKPTPKHSIDRIDVDGNYEPKNVRWATQLEQDNNRQNTIFVQFQEKEVSMNLLYKNNKDGNLFVQYQGKEVSLNLLHKQISKNSKDQL